MTSDDSDDDMEEFITNKIQETNEVETTLVTKGRTSLKDVLHLKDCSIKVGEYGVFRYEGEFFSGKNCQYYRKWNEHHFHAAGTQVMEVVEQIRYDRVSLGRCSKAHWHSKICLQKRSLCSS
ncbi:hypothetical protein AVEN_247172-1 [Araneus ventricosus]|uniref:Uncharacterized protein n=1 Tax=Araneus ventricosus TaxID=182803 RepID=A0A4Y2CF51_ARAVE|nr:hypothetical protein AVEN_247172-1 [Araneus ventricosus]